MRDQGLRDRVAEFYSTALWDFMLVWSSRHHYGIHYGFHDADHRAHRDAVLNMNRVLAERSGVSAGMRILDAGCGIGGSAIWLAEEFGVYVVGVTLSARQAATATQLAKMKGVNHLVEFHVRDFAETGLPTASFDVVWTLEAVCYAESKLEFLREAWRLLRTGGSLAIADTFWRTERISMEEKQEMDQWLASWAIPGLETVSSFQNLLQQAGFKGAWYEDMTKYIVPSAKRYYLWGILAYPLGKALTWLGIRPKCEIADNIRLGAVQQYRTLRKGLWVYGMFSVNK